MAFGIANMIAIENRAIPWLALKPMDGLSIGFGTGIALYFVLSRVWRPRCGAVWFFEHRIIADGATDADPQDEMLWEEIQAFDDGSSDYVVLVGKQGRKRIYVPTPSEDARTRVLALLIERGINRR